MKHKRSCIGGAGRSGCERFGCERAATPTRWRQGRGRRARWKTLSAAGRRRTTTTTFARTSAELAAQQGIRPEDIDLYAVRRSWPTRLLPVGRQALSSSPVRSDTRGHEKSTTSSSTIPTPICPGRQPRKRVGPCGSVLSGEAIAAGRAGTTTTGAGARTFEDIQEVQKIESRRDLPRARRASACLPTRREVAGRRTSLPQLAANGDYGTTTVSGGVSYQRPSFGSISLTASDAKTDYSKDGVSALLIGSSGFEAKSGRRQFERRPGGAHPGLAVGFLYQGPSQTTGCRSAPRFPATRGVFGS